MSGRDILLAEDTPADAELVLESLASVRVDGVSVADCVHVVPDGAAALDYVYARGAYAGRARAALPRLILLDIKLPRVDGFGVLEALKGDPTTREIPIVMLTSSLVPRDVARCYALGANSYVQKPVEFDEFRDVVQLIGQYWTRANAKPPTPATRPEPAA
jgi:two-component system response regulator